MLQKKSFQKMLPPKTLLWKIARHLGAIAALALLGGLLSATLVRLAPGFDADERDLDPSLNAESVRALHQSRAGEHNVLSFYAGYLRGAIHGDLGTSHALGQPVRTLLRERWPVTVRVAGIGLLLAWVLASTLAFTACLWHRSAYEILGTTRQRCISVHSGGGAGVAFRNPQRSRISRHRADRVPQDLPLFAQSASQGLHLAAHHRRPRPRTRRNSHPGLACASGRRSADDRTRRHHRQHRARRKHSRRSLVRTAGHWPTRLAGRAFQRPSLAGEPDRAGYARNLAGKLRGRCNELTC